QAMVVRGPGAMSVGASTRVARPELPGMGRAMAGGPPRVEQPYSNQAISTPMPMGQLRVIGAGQPLEAGIRQAMEAFFQADFSDVRVHEGAAARSIGALAFTLGNELHFAPGLYDPDSREGLELLGHELTHVVQQRERRVANPYGQGVAIVQDPALEAEADRMGQRIAEQLWASRRVGQPALATDRRPPRAIAPMGIPGMPRPSILAKLDGRARSWTPATANPIAWPVVQPAAKDAKSKPPAAAAAAAAAPAMQVDTKAVTSTSFDEEGLLPGDAEDLNSLAEQFNMAYTGALESRHTQAITLDAKFNMKLFTQRWMSAMGGVALPEPLDLKDADIVIGDQKLDENIHAEMLAISWYLQGKAERPVQIGVSKPVCARCSVVLSYFKIPHQTDGVKTQNWTSPWRHAELYPPKALKGQIPEIVRKGKEHLYAASDWR
ncbi:MAG TPA: DUF4157 domain-containing protein, partial [Kofleriaceae bacterium]|nr:DUF4157 domain-containing protein [Kofleriaceae bacterium]